MRCGKSSSPWALISLVRKTKRLVSIRRSTRPSLAESCPRRGTALQLEKGVNNNAGYQKTGQTDRSQKGDAAWNGNIPAGNGQIETTVTRAKEVRAVAEKMITIAKSDDLHSKRQVMAYVTKESVAKKLFDEIAPKYADRKGGYTQIVKIGPRRGDAAEMAIIKLV